MPALQALHAGDPRKELLKKIGDISQLKLFSNSILVAVYHRPNTTMLGGKVFHLTDDSSGKTGEDRYQGKTGLVVAKGPLAYVSDDRYTFPPEDNVAIGDWVCFRASDGWQLTLVRGSKTDDTVLCRMLVEADIRAKIPAPDYVW